MISTKEAVYRFKLEYDKLDSQDYPKLEIPQILIILNRAQNRIIKNLYTGATLLRTGAEGNQLRKDQFNSITVTSEPYLPTFTSTVTNEYYINSSQLTKGSYLHYYSGSAICSTNYCEEIEVSLKEYTWNEVNSILSSDNHKPSLEWQELPVFIAENKFITYSDGTFNVDKIKIDYIKMPIPFDLVGYTKFDGTASQNSDSDLPDFMVEDIITEAVAIAKGVLETEGYTIERQESNINNI